MNHIDAFNLIRTGVPGRGGVWADLGAGSGVFTRALADLLGPEGQVFAVDRQPIRPAERESDWATINPVQGGFHSGARANPP